MTRPTVLFLCGYMGSGKTTVGRFFSELGADVISADTLSNDLLSRDKTLIANIRATFGDTVFDKNKISRAKLAHEVFKDQCKLKQLESLELPIIAKVIKDCIWTSMAEVVVVELSLPHKVPELLKLADYVLLVKAPFSLLKQRVLDRDGSLKDFDARLKNQPRTDWLEKIANRVIVNDGTMSALKRRVYAVYRQLLEGKVYVS